VAGADAQHVVLETETDAAGSAAKVTVAERLAVKNKITHLHMQQKNARPAVKSKGACDDDQ